MALPRPAPLKVDPSIERRFEILALVGSGGMGRVYRARDRQSGEIVAIKILGAAGDAARLAREARLLGGLDHPGIVKVIDAQATSDGTPYIVMEWLSGHDLDDRLSRGPLAIDEAVMLAKRVADALALAHRARIVHRDVKPANVFLVDGDVQRAKLIDFGLARRDDDVLLTAERAVVGTPAYMAPEQIRGEKLDGRADLYALGAVLFAAIVGRAPFGGTHAIAVLAKAVAEPAPRPSDLRLDVPPAVDAIVERLLEKRREDRPGDAEEVSRELAGLLSLPRVERRAPAAITSSEQRVTCIVLCNTAAEREDPTIVEERQDLPEQAVSRVADIVEDLGGTLHRLSRDTSLVTIRGSAAPAEAATRAARCALAMAAARPAAPIVVATGRVVVSGSHQVGEVIDRATAALVDAMGRGASGVLADETTSDLLADRFVLSDAGTFRVLTREHDDAPRERTFLGKAAPCVGRSSELATIEAAFHACAEESRARALLVVAQPGMGKSRLVQELRARAVERGDADVLVGYGDPVRAGSSLGIAAQLVRRRAGISDVDLEIEDDARPKLKKMVDALFPAEEAERIEPFLSEIAGLFSLEGTAPEALSAARADATVMGDVLRQAWVSWLRALAERRTVILTIEDLHWADAASLRLVDAALAELLDLPLVVLGTSRPDIRKSAPDLWKKRALQEIHLGPLSPRASRSFIVSVLGDATSPAVVDALVDRSSGHPFLLEELVRAVAAGQGPDALPTSVLGMVQARLDELDADARRVLRAASVFGNEFSAAGVLALLGEDAERATVASHLTNLHDNEIVQRRMSARSLGAAPATQRAGAAEYVFRHALLCDAAYAMLTEQDRTLAHRLAAEWLESAGEPDPAILANHYDRGGSPERALVHFRRAAKAALGRSDLDRAAELLERAFACGPDDATKGALWALRAEIHYWRGELEPAADRAKDAFERVPRGTPAWFESAATAIGALGQRGKNDEVAEWLERIVDADADAEGRGAQIVALCRGFTQLSWAHHGGDLGQVRARLDRVAEPIEALSAFEAGWVHRVRAEASWLFDRDIDRCLAAFESSTRAFESAHAQRAACLTVMNHACLRGWSGDLGKALQLVDGARNSAEKHGWRFLALYAMAVTGMLEVFDGEACGAKTLRTALIHLGDSPRLAFICRILLGEASLARGDAQDAAAFARAAAMTPAARELRPAASALTARVRLAQGNIEDALVWAKQAQAEESAVRDLDLFECAGALALAEVEEARGHRDAARAAASRVHDKLTAIASTISCPEIREAFWSRRVSNDRVRALVVRLGIGK